MSDICLICPGCGLCVRHLSGCKCPPTTLDQPLDEADLTKTHAQLVAEGKIPPSVSFPILAAEGLRDWLKENPGGGA